MSYGSLNDVLKIQMTFISIRKEMWMIINGIYTNIMYVANDQYTYVFIDTQSVLYIYGK